jgi:hypothetical protein
MKLTEIQKIAKKRGIKILGKSKKVELIRIIQRAEGNFDCFGTAMNYCDQLSCLWRKDCLK